MKDTTKLIEPPHITNHEGGMRHLGVEIEFAATSAEDAASLIVQLFKGNNSQINPHRFEIVDTTLGKFQVELDFQYAHPDSSGPLNEEGEQSILTEFRASLQATLGDLSTAVVPCEVVCPPVPLNQLQKLEVLRDALRKAGAHDTAANIFYAFGLHLNPEIADDSARYTVSMLKAYLLLSDWLRDRIDVDLTRRILSFIEHFPEDYVSIVIDPGYWPGIDQLIDDYLAYNATRNRELDMLPLFAWYDEERVREGIGDSRVKKRPTFHYRLPNSSLTDPEWSLTKEWNRWCAVEHLAADEDKLEQMQEAYDKTRQADNPTTWNIEVKKWIP